MDYLLQRIRNVKQGKELLQTLVCDVEGGKNNFHNRENFVKVGMIYCDSSRKCSMLFFKKNK